MKHFLQHICDLVLISKPCAHSAQTAPFYFPVKNARNECPLSRVPYLVPYLVQNEDVPPMFSHIGIQGLTLF